MLENEQRIDENYVYARSSGVVIYRPLAGEDREQYIKEQENSHAAKM